MSSFFPVCQHDTTPCAGDSYGYSIDAPRKYGPGPKSLVFQANCGVVLLFCGRQLVSSSPRWKGRLGYLTQLLPLHFDQRSCLGPALLWSEMWIVFQMKEVELFFTVYFFCNTALWCDSWNAAAAAEPEHFLLAVGKREDRGPSPKSLQE